MSEAKHAALQELLRSFGSALTAYSGGVDSVFLAHVAHQTLGARALAVLADSPSLPRRELDEAIAIAAQFQFPLRVVRTREFSNPDYLANPSNRCYFCKFELFAEITPIAKAENFSAVLYGENASDTADLRPGAQAAAEFNIRAPLKEVGLTKAEIRTLSARFGLPTADKPQLACLSSRIPHGEPVTTAKLSMIEQAENLLRDLGFRDVRVRHHALSSPLPPPASVSSPPHAAPQPAMARIEVGPAELPRFLDDTLRQRVLESLRKLGYLHVTLDLRGYSRPDPTMVATGKT